MKIGSKIRIRKTGIASNPEAPTPTWDNYTPGQDNGYVSIPVEYTAEGELLKDIVLNDCIYINRTKRNDVEIPGFMSTSTVLGISKDSNDKRLIATTRNSIYLIEAI